jgi:methylmalonyl-CoA mutase
LPKEVIRSTTEEKEFQIQMLANMKKANENKSDEMLKRLQLKAIQNQNIFEELMETVKFCSLGQITKALFEVGGQYRRNM